MRQAVWQAHRLTGPQLLTQPPAPLSAQPSPRRRAPATPARCYANRFSPETWETWEDGLTEEELDAVNAALLPQAGAGNAARLAACRVLLLDVSMKPIDVLAWQRAITLSLFDKAEVLEYYEDLNVRSARREWPVPAVLKVSYFAKPSKTNKLSVSRRNVLIRDKHRCQYCDAPSDTIDHVLPVSRGGAWSWTNLVGACSACNARKGARTPEEARMVLRRPPKEPTGRGALYTRLGFQALSAATPKEWEGFV